MGSKVLTCTVSEKESVSISDVKLSSNSLKTGETKSAVNVSTWKFLSGKISCTVLSTISSIARMSTAMNVLLSSVASSVNRLILLLSNSLMPILRNGAFSEVGRATLLLVRLYSTVEL